MKKLIYLFILLLIGGFVTQTAFSQVTTKSPAPPVLESVSDNEGINAELPNGNNSPKNSILKSEPVSPGTKYYNPALYRGVLVSGVKSVGPSGADYTSITAALADIVTNGLTGAVYLELQPTYVSSVETFPLTFDTSLPTTAANTITIRPQAAATGLLIASSSAAQTIYINGGKHIYFDGRPGGLGSTSQLTIRNTFLSGTAFTFVNDAEFNTIEYCTVEGVSNSATSGVIVFSTTTGAAGNSNNSIDHCTISDVPTATTPSNLIYSSGTPLAMNSNNSVTNSNLLNWYLDGNIIGAINLPAESSAWTISGNSFYQTASRTFTHASATTSVTIIAIGIPGPSSNPTNTNGVNFNITNNHFGGTAPLCGGTPMTFNTTAGSLTSYRLLFFATVLGTASIIQGNTFANISLSTSTTLTQSALLSHGNGNVIIDNNTFGSQTTTGNITFTNSGSIAENRFLPLGAGLGLLASSVTITNNNIGSISVSSTGAFGTVLRPLVCGTPAGSSVIINNNIVGGTVANSIINSSISSTYGIMDLSLALNQQINNNIIRNITINNSASLGTLTGLYLQCNGVGNMTSTGNLIHDLNTNSANITFNNAGGLHGIVMYATTTPGNVLSENIMYNLSSTNTTVGATGAGICTIFPTVGTNLVSRNLVKDFTIESNTGIFAGIWPAYQGSSMIQNNMIRLGIDGSGSTIANSPQIMGIAKLNNTNNVGIYFNSVYIGGTGVVTTGYTSMAFYLSTIGTADTVMNNIFYNARSNGAALTSHYGIYLTIITGLVCNYNDILANGIGGVFGFAVATSYTTLATWQAGTLLDLNSVGGNPNFVNPTGNSSTVDLHVAFPTAIESAGFALTQVTDDYDGQIRATLTPTDIGADAGNFSALTFYLTALIQGFYNGATMIPDTVTVELRTNTAPYPLVESKKVILSSLGTANPLYSLAVNGTPYYVVLKHRNSIQTWSATPQTFSGSALIYDFTTAASKAYGNNQILIGTKWCIYNGDANQDGSVDALDMILIDNDVANFVTGYVPTDINGDGAVDALDMILCDNNSSNFVGAIKPPGAPEVVKIPKTYEQMQAIEKYMKNRVEQKQINDKMQKDTGTKPVKKSNN